MTRRFRAPNANQEILADPAFDRFPAFVEQNRRLLDQSDVTIGKLSLQEFRRQARLEILGDNSDRPLLITGHQPELFHPGVWVKNFAMHGLAKKINALPLHLIADHDTMKAATMMLPTWNEWNAAAIRLEKWAYDEFETEQPWEKRKIRKPEQWAEFVQKVNESGKQWGYEPLLTSLPKVSTEQAATWSTRFTVLRQHVEYTWGCVNREVTVSAMSQSDSFQRFIQEIFENADRFRNTYNLAVMQYRTRYRLRSHSHPVPNLAENELPFWVYDGNQRHAASQNDFGRTLRPRALTLTLFARLCLGDLFIHGIGGGKYDEVTDTIIRNYFGIEPPAYQVMSATLHLPLPGFPATTNDLHRLHRQRRELDWEPDRQLEDPQASALKRRKQELIAERSGNPVERRQRYRELLMVKHDLRRFVEPTRRELEQKLNQISTEVSANAMLRRRDFAWVLYPEAVLKPFLQQFLELGPI
jgi:hypothetical protein